MTGFVSGAACLVCDWTATGTAAECDKAAEKHTRLAGHGTQAWTVRADLNPNGDQA